MASWLHEDFEGAEAAAEEAIEAFETVDDKEGIVWAHLNRTAITFHQNNLEEAQRKGRDALNLAAATSFTRKESPGPLISWDERRWRRARRSARAPSCSAASTCTSGSATGGGRRPSWKPSPRLRLERGDAERAATLLAAADKIRAIVSTPVPKAEEATLLEAVGRCRSLLSASQVRERLEGRIGLHAREGGQVRDRSGKL